MDNIFVERLWRSLKYEEVYLKAYDSVADARAGIAAWISFYNDRRIHQALGYRTPREVFEAASRPVDLMDNAAALPTTPQAQQQPDQNESSEEKRMIPCTAGPHRQLVEDGIQVGGSLT